MSSDVQRPPAPTSTSDEARQFLAMVDSPGLTYPAPDDVAGWQQLAETTDGQLRSWFANIHLPVKTTQQEIRGVRTFVISPDDAPANDDGPILIDIHSGALLYGGGDVCASMLGIDALTTGMTTWAVDYRMPPLHPYPAALDDCLAVYQAALDLRDAADIFVLGGSAGGNLAAALILRAKDEGLAMPAALVLLSPEVDLTESGDSFYTNRANDNILSSLLPVNKLYANGHDLSEPYLSPLFGDLSHFPPTLLQAGTRDLFLSNTVRFHRKLRAASVDAELHIFEAMPHSGFGGTSPEDQELRVEVKRFIDRHRRPQQ